MFGNHINQKLSAYCHGELSPQEARRVTEHLLHCRRCRKEYEEINLASRLVAQLAPSKAPASLWDELEPLLNQAGEARKGGSESGNGVEWRSILSGRSLKLATACATLLLLIGSGALWVIWRRSQIIPPRPEPVQTVAWQVTRLEGRPKVGQKQIDKTGRLAIGEWLETDGSSRAQISVGEIGEVQVDPNSRIRLVRAGEDEHRLAIPRGKMHAFIWAPPGQFYVDTPSAVAIDLGCSYTLEVKDDGQGLLRVTTGWVAFELDGRESFVPAEAECVTRPRLGPGTPYFSDASREFQASLAAFDTAPAGDSVRDSALEAILKLSRRKDAFTLWHLLTRTTESERGRVYDRLAKLVPPPKPITREGILRNDRGMVDAWWDKLELGDTRWWRMWKGPVPSQLK